MEGVERGMSISMSDPMFDPVLGSLWDTEDAEDLELNELNELHELRLDKSNPSGFQRDGTTYVEPTYVEPPVSPPHTHELFLGLQLHNPTADTSFRDCGVLDDQIYQQQLEQRAGRMTDQRALSDEETLHLLTSAEPEIVSSPGMYYFTSPSGDISSSLASVSINSPEPSWTTRNATLSRSGSSSSIQTERGRSRLDDKSKNQRTRLGDRSSFKEHVFYSNPVRSISTVSASSGRRGPLDAEARAKMNAVKEIGPCWRCKALRKSCNAHTPCDACPTVSQSSRWHDVGCKRGSLKDAMPRVTFCLRSEPPVERQSQGRSSEETYDNESASAVANKYAEQLVNEREQIIFQATYGAATWNDKVEALISALNDDSQTSLNDDCHEDRPRMRPPSNAVRPLEGCILAILWELHGSGMAQTILGPWINIYCGTVQDFVTLLTFAAMFEAKSSKDNFISESLLCLLHCLETLRFRTSGKMGKLSHQGCNGSLSCKVDFVRKLTLTLERCALNISESIFDKGSVHNETRWLSTFYGLCIQSIVRNVLILLDSQEPGDAEHDSSGAHDHFRLATRLFIAISGRYDFLHQDQSMQLPKKDEEKSRIEEIKAAAQLSVKQPMWTKLGFSCSGDFLKHIFEDKDPACEEAIGNGLGPTKFAIHPKPYVPESCAMNLYRGFRSDWDLARCNYTKLVVSVGSRYGWLSETYVRTTKKWAAIEATWRKYHKVALLNTLKNNKIALVRGIGLEALLESQDEQTEASFQPPLINASLSQNWVHPEMEHSDSGDQTLKQSPRFDGDIYWPSLIRGQEDSAQEGWCGMCSRWLRLDGTFQDDKDFHHGVSAATGRRFDEPKEMRRMKGDPSIWWGLCGTCGEWVEVLGTKSGETAWFVHSFGCYA